MSTGEKLRFTRYDTNIVKGLAILAMVLHHVCPNNAALSVVAWKVVDMQTILASSGKVCVSLLTLLSGYGLSESYRKFADRSFVGGIRFCLSHYFQLLSMYWWLYAWAFAVEVMMNIHFAQLYGSGIWGARNCLYDLLGLSALMGKYPLIGGWYLSAIVVFYFMFPLVHWLVRRTGWVAVALAYLPWVWYGYVGDLKMRTDWWLFYLVSFALGIYLSHKRVLDRMMRLEGLKWMAASVALFVAALTMRLFWTLQFDPVLALACIVLSILVLRKIKGVGSLLSRLGALSAGIWLLHLFMRNMIAKLSFTTYYGRAALLIFLTIGVVMAIDEIKASLRYNDLVRKMRGYIESGWSRPPEAGSQ